MKNYFVILLFLPIMFSCREDIYEETNAEKVFEVVWNTLDNKYCFFDEKDVDWNEVRERYLARIDKNIDQDSLFYLIGKMICELRDGHVNLYSSRDIIKYWKWYTDYPANFDEGIENKYLGDNYKISSGLRYKLLSDGIGYITYRSFSSGISESGLDYILETFKNSPGIIIDIRNNTGGDLSNVQKLASRFTEIPSTSGYISHKTGSGHNDFSELFPIKLEPSERTRTTQKIVVLTNRSCYSAANAFASTMKQLPNVTLMGDKTGGGGGFPLHFELPNGWILRLSSCAMYDETKSLIESGIEPDYFVNLDQKDVEKNIDTIIEAARKFLKGN